MKRLVAVLLIAAAFVPAGNVSAAGHLVRTSDVDKALIVAAEQAAADRTRVEQAVSRPEMEATARRFGVEPDRLRKAVTTLSDAEVRDLNARAAALQSDPVATGNTDLLTLLLIILLVIVILKAV